MTHKLCQNANFENGGTTIQIGILHVQLEHFFNIFTVKVTRHPGYFEMQKRVVVSFYVVKKINKMQVAG